MKRVSVLLLLIFVFTEIKLSAQTLPSTLLWKISGNGLQKPSYLYGTMHLTDERIFNIGDSMYKAIESSEGFAIEINPDDFTPFIIDETKKSIYSKQRLKDMMSQTEFNKYGKALAKKLNKKEDDITTADVLNEKNKWIEESYKTGKMQTFLDVYLLDVARREGKWTGGVEDMQDQENLMSDLVDESDIKQLAADNDKAKTGAKSSLETMINIYLKSDLNGIERFSGMGDSLYHDKLLTKRNKKMAMRMDSMSHVRSMVFAVGAAHLPGSDGLISLLSAKGFSVTPVFSSKKVKPSDYKVPQLALPWYDVKDEGGLYSASMPGKPGNIGLYGVMNMQMYFDVFNSTVYLTSALNTPYSEKAADSVLGVMTAYYFEVNDYKKGKPITINEIPGREFLLDENKYSRGYLLYKDGVMYIAIAVTMHKKDTTTENAINRFLHSYVIHKPDNSSTKYIAYTNAPKAYRIELPVQPQANNELQNKLKDSTVVRDLQTVVDPKTGAYLFFGTNEAAPGYFILNDSTLLAGIRESQQSKFVSLTIDTTYFTNNHRVMEFGGIMKEAPVMMKAHYEVRGNRWYALVALYDQKKDKASVDRFFNSFQLLDFSSPEWKTSATDDASFSTWTPGRIKSIAVKSSTGSDSMYKYDCFDTSRANDYSVIGETFGKYYWQTSDSVLLEKLAINNVKYNDTLLSKKWVSNGQAAGIEMQIQESGSMNVKRKRLLLNDNKVYTLVTIQPATDITSSDNNRFFDDFKFTKVVASTQLSSSKASLLLTDLASQDSSVHANAKAAVTTAPFVKRDLPLLHEALLKKYEDDDEEYSNTKTDIQKIIEKIGDSSSYQFAKDQYLQTAGNDKNRMLGILLSFPTAEHFNEIKTLLLQQPPTQKLGYRLTSRFNDSLQLTASVFPGLLPLFTDTVMSPALIEMAKALIDSGYIQPSILQQYNQPIVQLAQQYYSCVKGASNDYDYNYYSVLDVLGDLNTTTTNTTLQNWTALKKSPYLQIHAAGRLLQNKQTVSATVWQNLAAEKGTRIRLYDTLEMYKKTALFPKEFLTQQYFAESHVYTAASDDEEPSSLTYLTQKVISFNNKPARFYFYKVTYGSDDNATHALACAGPFDVNVSHVPSKKAFGEMYGKENFDPENLPDQMTELIKQMEEGVE